MAVDSGAHLTFLDGADGAPAHRDIMSRLGEREFWRVNNSGIDDYSERARILGAPDTLKVIIAATLGYNEDSVGIDIAAGSDIRALRDLLDLHILRSAVATNFSDSRSRSAFGDLRVSHIDGDITVPDTWLQIGQWQERHTPEGFALAMHRPVGALQELPVHTYRGAAHFLLDRIKPGGLMFTQVPRTIVEDKREMLDLCRTINRRKDVVEVITSPQAAPGTPKDWADTYAVILKH